MRDLKEDTSHTARVGPFLSTTDGYTPVTDLSIAQADIRLSKNGGDFAQSNDSGGATHDENGWYYLTLDATDCNTAGHLQLSVQKTGALPVWHDYMVLPANVYDSLVAGTDYLDVEVATLVAAVANKIADHIIRRTFQNACDSSDGDTKTGRSLLGAIAKQVNKVAPNGSNLEIMEDDDTTVLFSQAMTTSGSAEAITALDTT